jgi:hypothetical protein
VPPRKSTNCEIALPALRRRVSQRTGSTSAGSVTVSICTTCVPGVSPSK